jgi:hypothetical protein
MGDVHDFGDVACARRDEVSSPGQRSHGVRILLQQGDRLRERRRAMVVLKIQQHDSLSEKASYALSKENAIENDDKEERTESSLTVRVGYVKVLI